ncbi:hypothetical protein QYE76_046953 [Lolium multiflorum]|uniref:Amino acid transporter transmembrane domain-containing protein n=1 Tax=Lolium multiflorum TaxID=4521 RepID=A0AAD8TMZ4_LOLMU|nr:hypothetical protein QYE76_046953 [Lolium multiflorum]
MAAPSRRGSHSQPFDLSAADTAPELDDDGRAARTGNLWTCVAHIITGVIGAGVLALSWSVAQLGWVAGPLAMLCFAGVTYVSAVLLSHCYRSPIAAAAGGGEDPSSGKMRRNYTYMDAVRALLGRKHVHCLRYVVSKLSSLSRPLSRVPVLLNEVHCLLSMVAEFYVAYFPMELLKMLQTNLCKL